MSVDRCPMGFASYFMILGCRLKTNCVPVVIGVIIGSHG